MGTLNRLRSHLWEPVDASPLIFFRLVFAVTAYFWAESFLVDQKYEAIFLAARFQFKYDGFEWVGLWPGEGIYWHFLFIKIAAVCLAVGFLSRLASAWIGFSIAYVLLVERAIYVNHYYLLACAGLMLALLPADRRLSLDAALGLARRSIWMSRWQLWLLRFQLGIPYVGGAIAKLNADWLGGQPAGMIVGQHLNHPWIGPLLRTPWAIDVFVYGGLLYDLLVVPMLLFRPTRWIGVALSVVFHLTNAITLQIGVFPWFMLASVIVFFPPQTLARRGRIFIGQPPDPPIAISPPPSEHSRMARIGFLAALIYVIVQLLLPIRPWIYPGDANWNERGHRFAWRMMLRHKIALTHFLIHDDTNNDFLFVPSTLVLTPYQSDRADHHPELVRQTAVHLSRLAAELGATENRVQALALVSLNGRQPKPLVDPTVDLSRVTRHWWADDWEIADAGPFRQPAWTVPRDRWWIEIDLPEPFANSLQGRRPEELESYLTELREKQKAGQQ